MADVRIGAGGWGYFSGGLEAYARGFRFVEVNATFYRRIPEAMARRWRDLVPAEFVFSVKANRDITHNDRLRATAAGRAAFAHVLRTARILRAPYVVLETPPMLGLDDEQVAGVRDLAGMVGRGTRIGLEARAYRSGRLPPILQRAMADADILDVVDLSQTGPRVPDDTIYTRLFGPGPHNVYEFDDEELRKIVQAGSDAVRVAFAFHGVRMYKDAARLLTFKRTGRFPAATSSVGVASLDEALRPDVRFPTTRDELVRDHGWKVIDIDNETRSHASVLLERLPDRRFRDLREVFAELGPILRLGGAT